MKKIIISMSKIEQAARAGKALNDSFYKYGYCTFQSAHFLEGVKTKWLAINSVIIPVTANSYLDSYGDPINRDSKITVLCVRADIFRVTLFRNSDIKNTQAVILLRHKPKMLPHYPRKSEKKSKIILPPYELFAEAIMIHFQYRDDYEEWFEVIHKKREQVDEGRPCPDFTEFGTIRVPPPVSPVIPEF